MKQSLIIAALLASMSPVSVISANELVFSEKGNVVQSGVQLVKKFRASNEKLPVERLLNVKVEVSHAEKAQPSTIRQSNSFWLTTTQQPR